MKRFVIIFICIIALTLAGCGKKIDPTPVSRQVVTKLSTTVSGNGTALCWSFSDSAMQVKSVKILRSAFTTTFSRCDDCPKIFVVVKSFTTDELDRAKQANDSWCYRDGDVKKGVLYSYKISLCDEKGNCHTPTTMTEIKY